MKVTDWWVCFPGSGPLIAGQWRAQSLQEAAVGAVGVTWVLLQPDQANRMKAPWGWALFHLQHLNQRWLIVGVQIIYWISHIHLVCPPCSYWQMPVNLCTYLCHFLLNWNHKSHTILELTGTLEIMQGIGKSWALSLIWAFHWGAFPNLETVSVPFW